MSNYIVSRDEILFPVEQVLDKVLNDFFSPKNINTAKSVQTYPKANVYVANGKYHIVFAVPGVKKENLQLECKNDVVITLKGKMSEQHCTSSQPNTNAVFYIRELKQTNFERSFTLPEDVKGQPNEVKLEDGLLSLTWNIKQNKDPTVKLIPIPI